MPVYSRPPTHQHSAAHYAPTVEHFEVADRRLVRVPIAVRTGMNASPSARPTPQRINAAVLAGRRPLPIRRQSVAARALGLSSGRARLRVPYGNLEPSRQRQIALTTLAGALIDG